MIRKILGNRIAVRRLPVEHVIARPQGVEESQWEAEVVCLGDVTEPITVGDRVLIERTGTQPCVVQDGAAELVSVLAVLAVLPSRGCGVNTGT